MFSLLDSSYSYKFGLKEIFWKLDIIVVYYNYSFLNPFYRLLLKITKILFKNISKFNWKNYLNYIKYINFIKYFKIFY